MSNEKKLELFEEMLKLEKLAEKELMTDMIILNNHQVFTGL